MILIRKTLLLPRSCSMNNMTPGPSPMTSVFLNLRAQLISAALSLTKSCWWQGLLPGRFWWSIHVRKPAFRCGLLGIRCAEAGYPGVYTQTSYFISWLNSHM